MLGNMKELLKAEAAKLGAESCGRLCSKLLSSITGNCNQGTEEATLYYSMAQTNKTAWAGAGRQAEVAIVLPLAVSVGAEGALGGEAALEGRPRS
jgi:hypothetical protein